MNFAGSYFGVIDNRFLSKSVGTIDPRPPLTVEEDDSVKVALKILRQNKVGCVVVVDNKGKLAGIFSERDVLLKLVLEDIDINETVMSDVMTKDPKSVDPTTTFAFALNMMSEGGFRHLPVVDEQSIPVGMISVKDIIDFIASGLTRDVIKS